MKDSGPPATPSQDLSFLSPRKSPSANISGWTFSALNKKRCKAQTPIPQEKDRAFSQTQGASRLKSTSNMSSAAPSSFDRDRPSISMLLDSSTQSRNLNVPNLTRFLKKYGQYPAAHRTLVWRVILRLPENEKSFAGLVSRGVHPNFENLYDQYPIRERRVFKRLQGLCSQLTHWNAVFGDLDYIPQLVLPFVVMFAADELSALETVMTILVWWGRSWHATFPNPPVHITDTFDILLDKHDPNLRAHFYGLHVPPGIISWKLLSTLFSELIPSTEWQVLMDHLFTHIEDYTLIYVVPIALMKLLRPSLLSATSSRQLIAFLRQPQTIDIERLLKLLRQLHSETSSHLLAACYTGIPENEKSEVKTPSRNKQKAIQLNLSNQERDLLNARDSVGAHEGMPIFPLPRGGYPTVDGYPPHLLDWQSKERAMTLSMKKEIRDNESCLKDLQNKLTNIEDNHNLWMQSQKGIEEKELKERKKMLEKERRHLSELAVLEEKISRQRLINLTKIEEIEKSELDAIEETKEKVQSLVDLSSEHMKHKVEQIVASQTHREAGEEADRVLHSKMQELYLNKRKESIIKETEAALRLKQDLMDASNRLKIAVWKQEDNETRLGRHQQSEQARNELHEQLIANQKREVDAQAKLIALEREAKLLDIERLRVVRSIKEEYSTKLFEKKKEELLRQEEILNRELDDVGDDGAAMQDLILRSEISEPRAELNALSLEARTSREQSDLLQMEAAMAALQRDHDAHMKQLESKEKQIVAEKAQAFQNSARAVRSYASKKQERQDTMMREHLKSTTDTKSSGGMDVDSKSVTSDDSDALFQQALRFVNQQTSPGSGGEINVNGGDVGSVSEDMIISAIEVSLWTCNILNLMA